MSVRKGIESPSQNSKSYPTSSEVIPSNFYEVDNFSKLRKAIKMKTKYKEMPELLKNRQSISGDSVTAFKNEGVYKVFSYDTLVYSESLKGVYFDLTFYSKTTSKIQKMIKDIFEIVPNKTTFKIKD
jgi:rRNA maturation protein Rpf1